MQSPVTPPRNFKLFADLSSNHSPPLSPVPRRSKFAAAVGVGRRLDFDTRASPISRMKIPSSPVTPIGDVISRRLDFESTPPPLISPVAPARKSKFAVTARAGRRLDFSSSFSPVLSPASAATQVPKRRYEVYEVIPIVWDDKARKALANYFSNRAVKYFR